MKLICLFAQRTERYPGQYAPELIAAIDEVTTDENPRFQEEQEQKLKEMQCDGEIAFWCKIVIEVDDEAFREQFKPDPPSLTGAILEQA